MWSAWDALTTKGETSVRAARAGKTDEPVKEEKQPDTPFQKAERALWIAVKSLEALKGVASPQEIEKIISIKKTLDLLAENISTKN